MTEYVYEVPNPVFSLQEAGFLILYCYDDKRDVVKSIRVSNPDGFAVCDLIDRHHDVVIREVLSHMVGPRFESRSGVSSVP
jgi:hypothetical protein